MTKKDSLAERERERERERDTLMKRLRENGDRKRGDGK